MSSVLHRTLGQVPPRVIAGRGIYLDLADGRTIIDATGGAAVACIGHGDRRVAEAIATQAGKVAYAHTGSFTSEPAEALADMLVGHRPGGLSAAFFVADGSVAMESALKLARQFHVENGEPQRVHYISRRQSYHGNLFGTLAASGHVARRAPYEAVLPRNFSQVSPCFAYRYRAADEDDATYVARLAAELEAEILALGADRVIAFIAETVVGATAGCVPPVAGYFAAIRAVCDRHGVLLILDEIMCGMGRAGMVHAWEAEGVTPDIQAVAKGLGGGYQPIGAILVHTRVLDALRAGTGVLAHGHTYQAHPVACAGALAVQRIIAEEGLVAACARAGQRLEQMLHAAIGDHPHVGDLRGRGLFRGIEFVADRVTGRPFAVESAVADRLKTAAFALGLAIYPGSGTIDGVRGDHILLAPPFNTTDVEIETIVDLLHGTVKTVFDHAPA